MGPARPWLIYYMLGFLATGLIWVLINAYWPETIAFKIWSGVLLLYLLSLRPVLGFGPKAKKRPSSR